MLLEVRPPFTREHLLACDNRPTCSPRSLDFFSVSEPRQILRLVVGEILAGQVVLDWERAIIVRRSGMKARVVAGGIKLASRLKAASKSDHILIWKCFGNIPALSLFLHFDLAGHCESGEDTSLVGCGLTAAHLGLRIPWALPPEHSNLPKKL